MVSIWEKLNNYDLSIKLTVQVNPNRFFDTEIVEKEGIFYIRIYRTITKLPVSWESNIPKRYKRNIINTELQGAKKIASNFNEVLILIKRKFIAVCYPIKFTESFIRTFRQNDNNVDTEKYIVPPNLFEVVKSVILFEISFCPKNETSYKQFIKMFHQLTNNTSDVRINWLTMKMRTLFQLTL